MKITITPEGTVIKDGEELGSIKGDVCILNKKPGPKDYGAIKEAAGRDLKFNILPKNAPEVMPSPASISPLSDADLLALAKARGLIPASPEPSRAVVNIDPTAIVLPPVRSGRQALARMLERVKCGEIPSPPPYSSAGDKTPAFVEWFRCHATPAQFEEQYQGRKLAGLNEPERGTLLSNELPENDGD